MGAGRKKGEKEGTGLVKVLCQSSDDIGGIAVLVHIHGDGCPATTAQYKVLYELQHGFLCCSLIAVHPVTGHQLWGARGGHQRGERYHAQTNL